MYSKNYSEVVISGGTSHQNFDPGDASPVRSPGDGAHVKQHHIHIHRKSNQSVKKAYGHELHNKPLIYDCAVRAPKYYVTVAKDTL